MTTIKAGGDFTTVSAYAADLDGNTLTANESGLVSGTITESSQIHFQNVTLAGFTLTLTADTGQSFADNANKGTNALRYNTANGAAVTNSVAGTCIDVDVAMTISKLQFRETGNYDYLIDASQALTLSQCIVLNDGASAGGDIVRLGNTGSVTNCLIYKKGALNVSGALLAILGGGTANNVTLARTGSGTVATGLRSAYGTLVAKNVAVFGATTDASGTLTGSTHNATDSAGGGFPNTNRQNSLVGATEWESVTDGSEDFRVKSSSSVKLLDLGTSTGTPSTDIVGQTRTGSYDIGAWEHQAAASANITAANTLGAATSSATVKSLAGITSARTLGTLTSSATISEPRNITAAQTLGQLGSVANLILIDPALANNTLGQMTSSAQVQGIAGITSAPTLGAVTSVAGINVNTVSASQTLGALTSSAVVDGVASITSAKTLGDASAVAVIGPVSLITGSASLDAMVSSAVVAHGHVMRARWSRRSSNAGNWTRRA